MPLESVVVSVQRKSDPGAEHCSEGDDNERALKAPASEDLWVSVVSYVLTTPNERHIRADCLP